jgi:predicted nucleotidyltransferase
MTLDELRATKRDAILAIAARHGVSRIRVFGSFARGEARNDSDLRRTLFDLSGLLLDLESLLHVSMDVVSERGLRPRVRERVLTEAVPL